MVNITEKRYNLIRATGSTKYYHKDWTPSIESLPDAENDCGFLRLKPAGNASQIILSAESCSVVRPVLCKQDSFVAEKYK